MYLFSLGLRKHSQLTISKRETQEELKSQAIGLKCHSRGHMSVFGYHRCKRETQEALISQAIGLKCHPRCHISVPGYHRWKRETQEALISQAIGLTCHPRRHISVFVYHRLLTNLKKSKNFSKTRLHGAWKSLPSNGCKTLMSGKSTKGSQILLISKASYYGILKKA